jgi:hypothetical protein
MEQSDPEQEWTKMEENHHYFVVEFETNNAE